MQKGSKLELIYKGKPISYKADWNPVSQKNMEGYKRGEKKNQQNEHFTYPDRLSFKFEGAIQSFMNRWQG